MKYYPFVWLQSDLKN